MYKIECIRIINTHVKEADKAEQVERDQDGHTHGQPEKFDSERTWISQNRYGENRHRQKAGAAVVYLVCETTRVVNLSRCLHRFHSG